MKFCYTSANVKQVQLSQFPLQPFGYFCLRTVATAVNIYMKFLLLFSLLTLGTYEGFTFKKKSRRIYEATTFLALPAMYLSNVDYSGIVRDDCKMLATCKSSCIFHELISILYDNNYMRKISVKFTWFACSSSVQCHFFLIIKYHQLN